MSSVSVVQCFDGFNEDAGWVPVKVTDTREEAKQWVKDEKAKGVKNDWRGLHYRINSCKYTKR